MKAVPALRGRRRPDGAGGRTASSLRERRWESEGDAASEELRRALRPLAARVRARWLAEAARGWTLVAATGAALVALGGRLLGREEWPTAAAVWALLALVVLAVGARRRRPGVWAVARAADGLGLAERVTSALHARAVGHQTAPLLEADALRRLVRIDARDYPLLERPAAWRPVGLALLGLALVVGAPLPTLDRSAADRPALAQARRSVAAVQALARTPSSEPLGVATAAQLAGLERELAAARSAAEAAGALEQTQERLALLPTSEDYATRRALDELAASWEGRGDPSAAPGAGRSAAQALREAAGALRSGDGTAVERALSELAAKSASMSPAEARELARALQAGANATRDLPELTAALRQAAAQASAAAAAVDGAAGATGGESERLAQAVGELGPELGGAAERAAGLQRLEQTLSQLGRARAELAQTTGQAGTGGRAGGPAASRSAGAAGAGAPSGASGAGQAGAAGTAGSGAGATQGGSARASAGSGSGAGASGAGASGAGASGAGTAGAGSGGASAGAGASGGAGAVGGAGGGGGAGAGGGSSPGQPGGGAAGPTTAGGGRAPSSTGATGYESVYAPSRLGGEGGVDVRATGQAAGASGPTRELPDGPLSLGEVRPYDQVFGDYDAAARQSLSRGMLPPALSGLVQRYFSSIAPEGAERADR